MEIHEVDNKKQVSALFQAIAFFTSLLCIGVFTYIKYQGFNPRDPKYTLKTNPDPGITIETGVHIAHFDKFYVAQNKFKFDGIIWFAYDPEKVSLDAITNFSIYNGEIITKSKPSVIKTKDKHIAQFRTHVQFQTQLNYLLYPLDDHTITLIISNSDLPKGAAFVASKDNIDFDKDHIPGWRLLDHTVHTGFSDISLEKSDPANRDMRQEVLITFFAERKDPKLVIGIFLTLLLLLFISLLTFSSDEDCVLIVTVGIVALIGFRMVLISLLPEHTDYFVYADYIYFFALVCTICTLLGGIVTREQNSSVRTKQFIITGIYAFFIGGAALMSYIL